MEDSLQALENLTYCVNGMESKEKYYNIIKQDLERLKKLEAKDKKWQELFGCDLCEVLGRELLKEENEKLKQENKKLLVNKNVAQGIATKYKKALDIIKRKIIYVFELKFSYSVIEYNISARNSDFDELTKEEYELLKEALGNE